MGNFHTTVMLEEAIDFLRVQKGKLYIDATLGGGGHTFEIIKRGGKVLGIDIDLEAIEYVEEKLKTQNSKPKIGKDLILNQGNFRDIDAIAHLHGFKKVAGILFDLGISSHQVDTATRGFSFQRGGPLDMRMDKKLGVTAADLLNALSKNELGNLFIRFGDEPKAFKIAEAIVNTRLIKPIDKTEELVNVIEKVCGLGSASSKTAATVSKRVFQALRIAVNTELRNIEEALPKAINLLERKGRLVVISFHSLEDRIVKNQFKTFQKEGKGRILTEKPILPSSDEIKKNSRSRSAKLRAFEV